MKEKLSPFEQREFKKMVLDDIRKNGDSPVIGTAIKGYFDLKRMIEEGNGGQIDPRMIEALNIGFVDIFGSRKDVEEVLSKWQEAQNHH